MRSPSVGSGRSGGPAAASARRPARGHARPGPRRPGRAPAVGRLRGRCVSAAASDRGGRAGVILSWFAWSMGTR